MKKTICDIDVQDRRVLVRVDYNVPMKDGTITDDFRIRASLQTIRYLLDRGAKVILMSHLGRPKGRADSQYSLRPVAERLGKLLHQKVIFAASDVVVDDNVRRIVGDMRPGEVVLLENTRFVPGEEKNDPAFAASLASLADVFVNDAFGTSHRAHASNVGVSADLPAVAGFLVERELAELKERIEKPEHPFIVILGGAKVSDKIGVIKNLLPKCDAILIGGAMANTFLAAEGMHMGRSLVEDEAVNIARDLLDQAKSMGKSLVLPVDLVVCDDLDHPAYIETKKVDSLLTQDRAVDIGPETVKAFGAVLEDAKLVVWNGPMGVFEKPDFARGTFSIAEVLSTLTAATIVGGGDSALAVKEAGYEDRMTHVSTGGGASLELLEGKALPGIEALEERHA